MVRITAVLLSSLAMTALAMACGTDAVGSDACVRVEEARCKRAPGCQIPLATPPHSGDDVAACVRYYRDACLHGLANPTDPGELKLKACVDRINTGDCAVVLTPESASECSWLVPPEPVATPDASSADAAVEAAAFPVPSSDAAGN